MVQVEEFGSDLTFGENIFSTVWTYLNFVRFYLKHVLYSFFYFLTKERDSQVHILQIHCLCQLLSGVALHLFFFSSLHVVIKVKSCMVNWWLLFPSIFVWFFPILEILFFVCCLLNRYCFLLQYNNERSNIFLYLVLVARLVRCHASMQLEIGKIWNFVNGAL